MDRKKVSVVDRPIPSIRDPKDIIVKVQATALCGSELHTFRGYDQPSGTGFVIGHAFTGLVSEVGSEVKAVQVGDKVVAPFTTCLRPMFLLRPRLLVPAEIPWDADEAKNIRVQMGRCPVHSVFSELLQVLEKTQDQLGFMFDKIMPLTEAAEGYDLFDKMKVQQVIFKPWRG
ncbi:hypothetical protein P8C59_005086 [Phyllachora maydis]|uniref:Alcohol dehydrogenase-like N-terminal domain-containing protein n=1 Tax=Phyllachora maydis TaxID=1825666 RepID=A0AAD9MD58_9PEZI|nr:hypothetical protein P8C59_005086 [Phyllachora maydis]